MKAAKKQSTTEQAAPAARRARADIHQMRLEIEAAGAQARGEVESIRAGITAEEQRIALIERAPVSEAELEARIDRFIAANAQAARDGTAFDLFAAPADAFNESNLYSAFQRRTTIELLASLDGDRLRAALLREALRASADRDAPPMSSEQRRSELIAANRRLISRMAEEEIACRALDEVGLSINRRPGVPQDVRDASIDELEAAVGEA